MKFKVGDLCKVIDNTHCHFFSIGEIVCVIGEGDRAIECESTDGMERWIVNAEDIELISKTQTIEIKQKKNNVSAVLFENGQYIKHANAYCNPSDTFNFEIGRDLAVKRLLGIEDKPLKEKFKLYLRINFTGTKCGNIGEETIQVDLANNKLFVGDTVDIYKETRGYLGERSVVKNEDYKSGAIQGVANRIFQNGKNEEYTIIKKRSYKDVTNGEIVGSVKYIKEEI